MSPQVGIQLRTTLRVKQDPLGNDMIYPWKSDDGSGLFAGASKMLKGSITYSFATSGVIVYLEIDNRKCKSDEKECFSTANEVSFAPVPSSSL